MKKELDLSSFRMALDGKVALVTGSTSGIGLGIARTLANNGCKLILTGLADAELIEQLIKDFKQFKFPAVFVPCDLRSPASIKEFCCKVTEVYADGIDILVNNAGIQYVCNVEDYPDDRWDDMISICLSAPFHLIKHFLPEMKKKGWGRIVNIASQMGIISQVGKAPYSAAKSGLIGLTRGVALETAPFGITCNAVCPAFVYTDIVKVQIKAFQKEEDLSFEEAEKRFFAKLPTKTPVEIQEIADFVTFLCNPETKSITGSPLLIDAGFTVQ